MVGEEANGPFGQRVTNRQIIEEVNEMRQTGETTEGKPVYAGVFPLVGTHGIPLELILDRFKETDRVMDWPQYVADALKDGHKPRTIKGRILAAVGDVYGASYRQQVEERLSKLIP